MKIQPPRKTWSASPARLPQTRLPRCHACRGRASRPTVAEQPAILTARASLTSPSLGAKRCRRSQQPAAVGAATTDIRDVVAKSGDKQWPGIERTDNHGVVGQRILPDAIGDIISAAVDRIVEGDYRARRVAPHVKTQVKAVARKQRADAVAEILLELHLTDALTGIEKPPAVLDAGLEHLAREEHHCRFDDREQQRKEHRRDQGEFDGGRTAAVAAKSAHCISDEGG